MRPLTCYGGYPNPLREGKFSVVGMRAIVSDPTAASRVTLVDDSTLKQGDRHGRILDKNYKASAHTPLIDAKGVANNDGTLEIIFPEPMTVLYGLSAVATDNIEGGTLSVFIR